MSYISSHFLKIYQVDYKDPSNFIYVMNNKDIQDYKSDKSWNYPSIFKLYMKYYYTTKIICNDKKMTTFPIYPNMETFEGNHNQLTSFSIQPNMKYFLGRKNQLTSFPIQPNMLHFSGEHNRLTNFPIQPNMLNFHGDNNQ